jgi:methyltransferase (TIGR00027 family)
VTTQQQWDIVTSVGITALGVAAGRAIETHRDDPMIHDPFAGPLVRAAEAPMPMPTTPDECLELLDEDQMWELNSHYLGVRTRFFDEFFERAWQSGVRQAVILASGLDARAYRLDWPAGSTVFEIDQPKVLEFKESVLGGQGATARCAHRLVPVDLRDDWAAALADAGFDSGQPTAWLAEGLLPYLPPEAERQLLETIDGFSAPGSRISIEHPKRITRVLEDDELNEVSRHWGIDMRELLFDDDRPDAADELRELGWKVEVDPVGRVADGFGRPLDPSMDRMAEVSQFITAERTP